MLNSRPKVLTVKELKNIYDTKKEVGLLNRISQLNFECFEEADAKTVKNNLRELGKSNPQLQVDLLSYILKEKDITKFLLRARGVLQKKDCIKDHFISFIFEIDIDFFNTILPQLKNQINLRLLLLLASKNMLTTAEKSEAIDLQDDLVEFIININSKHDQQAINLINHLQKDGHFKEVFSAKGFFSSLFPSISAIYKLSENGKMREQRLKDTPKEMKSLVVGN